jgi:hypothetical protein
MYLLYLDDSGSTLNVNEKHFVLGGICVKEDKNYFINQRLNTLAESINKDDPDSIEFHASRISAGRDEPWSQIKDNTKRYKIIKDVLGVLNQEPKNLCIFACAIHKDSFKGQDCVKLAFEDLCSRFNMFLDRIFYNKHESHRGIIIFDKSSHEASLQGLATDFKRAGTHWGSTLPNLQEVPLFVDSKASRLIQLADHVAYAVFRRYEYMDLHYFNVIERHFDTEGPKIHGLVHKQFYSESCTCPACLSRRSFQSSTAQVASPPEEVV